MPSGVVKRKTPSSMVSLMGTGNGEDQEPRPVLDSSARDGLLLKLTARVERIDNEQELVVEAIKEHSTRLNAIKHDTGVISSDVTALKSNMETVKDILTDILAKLD